MVARLLRVPWRPGGLVIVLAGSWWAAHDLLRPGVERASFAATLMVGTEVTVLCLLLAVIPVYLAHRQSRWPRLTAVLIGLAGLSLLVPTIARSLALAATLAYYGPLATALRAWHIWPEGRPLDSSHAAVILSLVTLYLPLTVIILADGVRGLGRAPDRAATAGASPMQAIRLVILPMLARPAAAAALVIFSQTLGVIVTPRILGSEDVTLAMLMDDLLKLQLNTPAALRVAAAELALALPLAAMAAKLLADQQRHARGSWRADCRTTWTWLVPLPLLLALALVPVLLVLLSFSSGPVLALPMLQPSILRTGSGGLGDGEPAHNVWGLSAYAAVLSDQRWRDVLPASLLVASTAVLAGVGGGAVAAVAMIREAHRRAVLQWFALLLLCLPHNAMAVVLALAVDRLRAWGVDPLPPWVIGGLGQAIPAFGVTTILVDRALRRLTGALKVASTLGATAIQAALMIVLPALGPVLAAAVLVTTLISVDDVIFIRYLPATAVETFATELFSRSRYGAGPELAAACVLIWIGVIGIGLAALSVASWWRLRGRQPAPTVGLPLAPES